MDIKLNNVFYINLDYRTDRKIKIEKQLNILEWQYERFPAIKHNNGSIGCSMSHLKLLELAKENNLDYIVILEDDITFTNIKLFQTQLNKFLKSDIHYDILLLGGNSYASPAYQRLAQFCIRTFNCQTTIGYIAKKHFYDILIKNFKESIENLKKYNKPALYACDIHWKKLQRNYTFLFLTPPTVTQIVGDYSDIDKKKWTADRFMLNIDKK